MVYLSQKSTFTEAVGTYIYHYINLKKETAQTVRIKQKKT